MKRKHTSLGASLLGIVTRLFVLSAALSLSRIAPAAATFTLTPAAVSNNYSGVIKWRVAGLASGETVLVQKYADLDASGAIDAGDWLVQQFTLTDDQAGMVIGGVTNYNVPGDMDVTDGQIMARQNFQNGDFVQNVAGPFLFQVSSPSGRFAPITTPFVVSPAPYPQSISGSVVSHGTNVPNAVVILFPPPRPGRGLGTPRAAVIADHAGHYTLPAPTGSYAPVAFKSHYLVDASALPVLTLNGGATITTNLALTDATAGISGRLVDANNASLGLPGILLMAQSSEGFMGIGFTDASGNFALDVRPGQWGVRADDLSLVVHGYLGLEARTAVNAPATGVTLAVPKATALLYGHVTDQLGNPLAGIDVYVSDNQGRSQTDGYTDPNGNYFAGVVGGGNNDAWQPQISGDTDYANYIFSQAESAQYGGVSLIPGQAVEANFTALPATQDISGSVQANGAGLAGIGVYAWATLNGVTYNQYTATDSGGHYALRVANGSWNVGVSCSGGNDSLDQLLGSGNYQCPNNQTVTLNNNNGTAAFTVGQGGGVQITTSSLLSGQVGYSYDAWLQAAGGNNAFLWSLNGGSQVPPGLHLGMDGHLYGTPTTAGTYNLSVHVEAGSGVVADQNLTLTINALPLRVTNAPLPKGCLGGAYRAQLEAGGGQPPYSWSLALGSAALPPALSLNSAGLISGQAGASGTFNFIVTVTDASFTSASSPLEIILGPRPTLGYPTRSPANEFGFLVNGLAGQNYTLEVSSDLLHWTSLQVTNAPSDTFRASPGSLAPGHSRYYRVMVGP